MKNTKTISTSKNFRKSKFLPLITLLLMVVLLSSPFLSIVRGDNFSITYTLKMGGLNPTANPVTYDNTVATPILDAYDPVYEFMGWNVIYWANFTQMLTPQKNFVIPAGTTGRVELAAIFDTTPKGFPINYNLDGGVNHPSNRDRYFGDNDHFPIDFFAPSKSGYTFAGWTVVYSDGFTSPITTPTTSFSIHAGTTEAITLTAHWTVNTYTISYDPSSGVLAPSNPATYTVEQLPITITPPTRAGYNFQQWTATYANGSSTALPSSGIPKGTTGNIALRAVWTAAGVTYDVHYYLTGTTTELAPSVRGKSGIMASTITENAASIPGYTADATTKTLTLAVSGNEIVFYYTPRIDISYVVHYYLTGTTTSLAPDKTVVGQTMNTTVIENAAVVAGYTVDSNSKHLTLAASGNVITFYYTPNIDISYVVHYYLTGTTTSLAPDKTVVGQTMNATVTESAVSVAGYTVDAASKSLTLAASGNVFAFYYTPDDDISYVVHYYKTGTTISLAADKTVLGQTMANIVTENAVAIAGYTVDAASKSLTLAATGNEIIFYYNENTNIEYTVHYYVAGTSNSLVADKVVTGQTMNATVTESAVSVAGYSVDAASKSLTLAASGNVITFYYTPDTNIQYVVHYYLAGTTTSLIADKTVTGKTMNTTVTEDAAVIAGYTADFASKSLLLAASGNEITFYYDVALFTITYVLNGGTQSSSPASYTVDDLPLPITVPTRAGYPFLRWIATCSNGSQIPLTSSAIPAGTSGNIVLSAVWDIDNPFVYDITYMLNGGSLDANRPTKYTIENATKVNSATMGTPTKIGYNIDRWFVVTEDGTFIDVSAAGLPAGTIGNIIVVVFWVEYPIMYTINYELAGGVNVGNAVDYSVESRFDIYINAPIRAGYDFMYWMLTCANGTQLVLPATGIPKGTAGDLKLTAVWNPNPIVYSIGYDLNGGSIPGGYNPAAYTVASGAISITAPVKSGHTFQGWTITYNYGSATEKSEMLVGSTIPAATTGNILLAANWAEI